MTAVVPAEDPVAALAAAAAAAGASAAKAYAKGNGRGAIPFFMQQGFAGSGYFNRHTIQ
jgi:hypothetical protein